MSRLVWVASFILHLLTALIPTFVVTEYFLPRPASGIICSLFVTSYFLIRFVPEIIVLVLYIVGIIISFIEYPWWFIIFYIFMLILSYYRFFSRMFKRRNTYEEFIKDTPAYNEDMNNPKNDIDMNDFDVTNDDDDYDYYR